MKRILILSFALLLGASVFTATARAANPANTDPATASYINGLPQSLPANASGWYKFEYIGDKSPVTVLMPNGTDTLVAFNVLTPEESRTWWDHDTKPIGRGTAYPIDCTTGQEVTFSDCKSPNLKWVGQFNFPGTFYVQVVNYNTGTANFTLTITGTGVIVPPPALPPAAIVTPKPAPQTGPLLPTTGGIWWALLNATPLPLKVEVLNDW